ncbi:family 10 glycosylhydrolase [Marinoscillum furvescens]|uniref:Uncharacterized lipoprotein YddW (UPF0748 family) n=1 Tax=Marinoscillum furvescens DSM 4134 TaxID=1122208 RepID=A0A3D9KYI9_MARFU|nr:family 10 glycosylhydrolase [Marinoscillum furvescens]RED93601.1 uncharacterized lipoprotein YddW (UPF0748 family) [Marinoscillum furvescens DSM 4134]
MKNYLKQSKFWLLACIASLALVTACSEEEPVEEPSGENLILDFKIEGIDVTTGVQIDHEGGTVKDSLPVGTDLTSLVPIIEVSEKATISPASGEAKDFSSPVVYVVTAENGANKIYTVTLSVKEEVIVVEKSDDNDINEFFFSEIFIRGKIDGQQISGSVPYGTDITNLKVSLDIHEKASVSPAVEEPQDFTSPVTYTVTAENGETQSYNVSVTEQPQDVGVRGVWLTNVDSNVLTSKQKIDEAVALCDELNINTIFVVTWNKALTTYPSDVAAEITGKKIDPLYEGRDPLRELIDAAHAKDIKVMAWFEYGFAAYNGSPGPILDNTPDHWKARDVNGNVVVKNGFYWMNAFHPDVQQFMIDLFTEVVTNYPDIDGVQGDDRLPATPSEAGYDDYTVSLYKADHDGQEPPATAKNTAWLRWRADILNKFGKALYDSVKAIDPNMVVAHSPSPMSFGYDEYLQDYTTWVAEGYSDIVSPQLYRRENQGLNIYKGLLSNQYNMLEPAGQKIFYPGLLLFLGGYLPSQQFIADMVQANREIGVQGEVYFFFTGFQDPDVQEVMKAMYPTKAIYPEL